MSDDLAERLVRIRDKYSMVHDEYDSITKAAAEIHIARESLHAVYLYGSYDGAAKERAARDAAEAQVARLWEALERLRDCDWVITLPDRMDAVRDIARQALEETENGRSD